MKFSEAHNLIQTGDVLLFRGRKWYAWLIRLRTLSVYSHVGIAYRLRLNGHHRLCIFEAVNGQGIRLHPMDQYLKECMTKGCTVDWYSLAEQAVEREKIADYCFEQWARRYASIWQFAWSWGLFLRRLRRWLGLKPDIGRDRFFCSELCDAAFRHAGYQHDETTSPALTDPGTVARYTCLQRKGTLIP